MVLAICGSSILTADEFEGLSLRPHIPFEDNIHREYRVELGLPSNTINDVVQTRDGFVWAATGNGLVRFDGKEFRTFNRSNTPDFPANNVERLYEDRDGTLWFGTEGGLARYRAGVIERITALDGIRIMAIVQRRDGSICVGAVFNTWTSRDGDHFEILADVPGGVRSLFEDEHGTLWIGARLELLSYSERGLQRFPISQLTNDNTAWTPQSGVAKILARDDGALWIGTSQGLFEFRDGVFTLKLSGGVWDMLQTRTGSLYVQTDYFLYRRVGDSFEMLERSSLETMSLAEDHEGGLWIGKGFSRGLHHYVHHPARYRFVDRPVYCMLEGSDGEMWLGSDQGLHLWERDHEVRFAGYPATLADPSAQPQKTSRAELAAITTYGRKDGLPGLPVRALARGSGETIWVGTAGGLCRWTGTELVHQDQHSKLNELEIVALHESRDGALWIGQAPFRTFRLFDGELKELTSLEEAGVKFFHEDADGRIWAGTNKGLFRETEGTQFEPVHDQSFDRLLSSNFLSSYVDPGGSWWMGTRGGLVLCREGRFHVITPGDGLASEYIERLHADASGENLWMGGRRGFFSVPRADLEEFITGTRTQVRSQQLPRSHELVHWSVGARSGPTSCLTRDGTLWISDGLGTFSLPPRPSYLDLPPPQVHINGVRLNGESLDMSRRFEFRSGPRRLAIDFAAPTFVQPDKARTQYRLEGHEDDWIDAGSERVAYYTDLRPGEYEFQVRADNGYGAWSEQAATLGFTVNPRWWEMTSLQVAALLGAIAVGIGYFRYRMRKVRHSNAALHREITERKRAEEVSRDHFEQLARVSRAASMGELTTSIAHEIKQPLFAIVSNAQTARRLLEREVPDVDEVRDALGDISSDGKRASEIIDHVRSLVKKGQAPPGPLNLNEIARQVTSLVAPDLTKRGLNIETQFASDLPLIHGSAIELQQVILNLLINGAQAMDDCDNRTAGLRVRTMANNGSVELTVEDQGKGIPEGMGNRLFDPFFTTKSEGTGMGLAINRTIIDAHGGRIWSTPNEDRGTTFHVALPAVSEDVS